MGLWVIQGVFGCSREARGFSAGKQIALGARVSGRDVRPIPGTCLDPGGLIGGGDVLSGLLRAVFWLDLLAGIVGISDDCDPLLDPLLDRYLVSHNDLWAA